MVDQALLARKASCRGKGLFGGANCTALSELLVFALGFFTKSSRFDSPLRKAIVA